MLMKDTRLSTVNAARISAAALNPKTSRLAQALRHRTSRIYMIIGELRHVAPGRTECDLIGNSKRRENKFSLLIKQD